MGCIGVDTSCYRTSVAFADASGYVQQRRLVDVPMGQTGLMQSELMFQHVKRLPDLIEALIAPGMRIDCLCATVRPRPQADSYMPVFRAGEGVARAMAAALRVPFLETTHQQCHLRAAMYGQNCFDAPFLAMHLSGGTTEIMLAKPDLSIELLGGTSDLHAGQFVDRAGVALGCAFPAGPHLEEMAVLPPQSMLPVSVRGLSCSFSGAETQIQRIIAAKTHPQAQIAAEVYSLLVRTIARMLEAAAEQTGIRQVLLFGGVASSALFRKMLCERLRNRRIRLTVEWANPDLSGDNAVGAALIGLDRLSEVVDNQ